MSALPTTLRLPPYVLLDWGSELCVYDESEFLTHLIAPEQAAVLRDQLRYAAAALPPDNRLGVEAAQARALHAFMGALPLPPVRTALTPG